MKSLSRIVYYSNCIKYFRIILNIRIHFMMRKMLSTKIPEDFGEFLEDFNKMNLRYDLGLFNLIPNRNILSLNVS